MLGIALALGACTKEARVLDADQPVTAPVDANDPRGSQYRDNAYQVAQGGRYFAWYGCTRCHGDSAAGTRDLADASWRHGGTIDRVYASIAHHGALGRRIPPEQIWQLAAYTVQLSALDPPLRRRQDLDQIGEPSAGAWQGPVR